MIVIDKKPIPLYEVECNECGSKIQYKASEVNNCQIVCPVCGISNNASTIMACGYLKQDVNDEDKNAIETFTPIKEVEENVGLYTKCVNGKPVAYAYGEKWVGMALYMDDIGYPTEEEAREAWERGIT